MSFLSRFVAALAVPVLLVGCAGTAADQLAGDAAPATEAVPVDEAALAAIAEAGQQLLDAYQQRDLERWLAGFTDDVVLIPPGERMIVGLEAAREASRIQFELLEPYETELEMDLEETVVAGDWAFSRSGFEVTYLPRDGGEPIVERARSLSIWQRQPDGSWLISRHMVNRPTRAAG